MIATIEILEGRRLLSTDFQVDLDVVPFQAASVTVTSRGTMVVKCTAAHDVVSIRREGNSYAVDALSSDRILRSTNGVKRILVESGAGNDRVGIDASVAVPVTVAGGGGNDKLTATPGDVLIGGAGNDVLFIAVPRFETLDVRELAGGDKTITYHSTGIGLSVLSGGAGDDLLVSWAQDSFIGGKGNDTARLFDPNTPVFTDAGGTLNPAKLSGIERQINLGDTAVVD